MTIAALPREDAVFALFDGDYHYGLGALANSLYRSGFRGIIYAAYRDKLPPWVKVTTAADGGEQAEIAEGCAIRFIKVDYRDHLTFYKPEFMLSCIARYCADAKRLYYFDVDLVLRAPWAFLQDWAECGIALCQDMCEPGMAANHPLRRSWQDIAARSGFTCRRFDGYYNGGFVALSVAYLPFLETWRTLHRDIERSGIELGLQGARSRPDPLAMRDQDLLNVALMASNVPISPLDNSGMDMSPGGYAMSHALNGAKPWRRRYLLDALRGLPPDAANKEFWTYVSAPIEIVPAWRRRRAVCALGIAAAIGRFYRRR
jgi:hypothetical protein